jgi:hypothetical protein
MAVSFDKLSYFSKNAENMENIASNILNEKAEKLSLKLCELVLLSKENNLYFNFISPKIKSINQSIFVVLEKTKLNNEKKEHDFRLAQHLMNKFSGIIDSALLFCEKVSKRRLVNRSILFDNFHKELNRINTELEKVCSIFLGLSLFKIVVSDQSKYFISEEKRMKLSNVIESVRAMEWNSRMRFCFQICTLADSFVYRKYYPSLSSKNVMVVYKNDNVFIPKDPLCSKDSFNKIRFYRDLKITIWEIASLCLIGGKIGKYVLRYEDKDLFIFNRLFETTLSNFDLLSSSCIELAELLSSIPVNRIKDEGSVIKCDKNDRGSVIRNYVILKSSVSALDGRSICRFGEFLSNILEENNLSIQWYDIGIKSGCGSCAVRKAVFYRSLGEITKYHKYVEVSAELGHPDSMRWVANRTKDPAMSERLLYQANYLCS